ncbi:MAG: CHAT domain-containing protein, partial [bacterium]|nr:CHAT domain-containing protein [bacterium]
MAGFYPLRPRGGGSRCCRAPNRRTGCPPLREDLLREPRRSRSGGRLLSTGPGHRRARQAQRGRRFEPLLQAWEIFEHVRLDADLVVLSACQSALGEERGGDGLLGLTRAFQYAGARSVVASLWQVSDRVTPELMVRFYRHLRSGKPKDQALQAAQIELIREPITVVNEFGRE